MKLNFAGSGWRDAADQLMIAKWIIRNLAYKMVAILHLYWKSQPEKPVRLTYPYTHHERRTKSRCCKTGYCRGTAHKAIAGILIYLQLPLLAIQIQLLISRLVPHQEVPTNICWETATVLVLVRVPLGWAKTDMCITANRWKSQSNYDTTQKQTENAFTDGSADLYQLIARLAVAGRHGFELENALDIAEKLVNVNIHQRKRRQI